MKALTKKEKQDRLSRNEEKWTETLMSAGWTVLPTVILERQKALGLDALDINILMQLASYWWYSDNPPYPSKQTIADCIGVDKSTVRKRIARMEKDGLIRRESRYHKKYGQQSNIYHFNGLIKEATPYAKESIEARTKVKQDNVDRRNRKRKLEVVK
jgi:DNA-binding Lrp family transcriptional regulator